MLNQSETEQARSMGWQLCEVYDTQQGRLTLTVLPTDFKRASSEQALQHVTAMAKQRHPLAIKALTLIAQFNLKRKN
jgi:hypothetical protein